MDVLDKTNSSRETLSICEISQVEHDRLNKQHRLVELTELDLWFASVLVILAAFASEGCRFGKDPHQKYFRKIRQIFRARKYF